MIAWILGFIQDATENLDFPVGMKLCGVTLFMVAGGLATYNLSYESLSHDGVIGWSLLRWCALLLAAPLYTVSGSFGVVAFGFIVTFVNVNFRNTEPNFDFWFVGGLHVVRIVGYTWSGAKLCFYILETIIYVDEHSPSSIAAQEKILKDIQEKKDRELAAERAQTQNEFKEIVTAIAELSTSAGAPALEMIRVAGVVEGDSDLQQFAHSPEDILLFGTLQVLATIVQAYGAVPVGIVRLYHAIRGRLEPSEHFTVKDCAARLEANRIGSKVGVPLMVLLLEKYDQAQGTGLCARAASIYCTVVRAASGLCGSSVAVKIVVDGYIGLLSQYLRGSTAGDYGAGSHYSSAGSGASGGNQGVLFRSYEVLGVASDATDEEVKSAYRDLAKIWHPDRFSEKDARLRTKAEAKFREVQEAFEFIKQSRVGASSPPPKRPTASTNNHSSDEDVEHIRRRIDGCRDDIQAFLVSFKAGQASICDWRKMFQRQDEAARQLREVLARIQTSTSNASFLSLRQKLVILEARTARLRKLYEWESEEALLALEVLPDGSLAP